MDLLGAKEGSSGDTSFSTTTLLLIVAVDRPSKYLFAILCRQRGLWAWKLLEPIMTYGITLSAPDDASGKSTTSKWTTSVGICYQVVDFCEATPRAGTDNGGEGFYCGEDVLTKNPVGTTVGMKFSKAEEGNGRIRLK